MITWHASDPTPYAADPHRRWAYNALDGCATHGSGTEMEAAVDADPALKLIYDTERRLSAPALAVSIRGIKIDEDARPWGSKCLKRGMDKVVDWVRRQTHAPELNINSPAQLKTLFFETLGLAEMRNKDGNVSTDRSVMERIRDNVKLEWARPKGERPLEQLVRNLARAILMHRDWAKQREIYTAALHNGRMRCTISAGSTETWRFSATKSCMGDGRNLQNITKPRRIIFVPDPGFTLYQIDQRQAESLVVAYVSGDENYILAHKTDDTHVFVARMCSNELDWPNRDEKCPKCHGTKCPICDNTGLAEQWFARKPFFRHHSLRDLYKRIQHGTNNGGTYRNVARNLKCPEHEAMEKIDRYYGAFPGIPRWHQEITRQVKEDGIIYYPGGYKRIVLGRRNDPATHRECIASVPQSVIAWINHAAFANIWHTFDGSFLSGDAGPDLQVLLHVHDAVLFQSRSLAIAQQAHELAGSTVWPMPGGEMRVPWDFKSGTNWKAVS